MTDFAQRRTIMVDTQVRPNEVTSYPIIDAMLTVPREQFVPDSLRELAYVGENIPIGPGRVLLEPRTLARMIEELDPEPDQLVLDVGCGYGYGAAILARLSQAVVAVEEDEALAAEAQARLSAQEIFNVAVVAAPLAAGCPAQGPYDAMLIEGGIETMPDALVAQLREGGRVVALFCEDRLGIARLGTRVDGVINWRFAFHAGAPVLPGFAAPRPFIL